MKTDPVLAPHEITARLGAENPREHAWVMANAGSGKTTLLAHRVLRVLLAGTPPDRLLCVTFTKAAAAEMQKRIFDRLARWTQLDDEALCADLRALQGLPATAAIAPHLLYVARTLFAHAIETPGGLKVQTIHAFAERVLHACPIEAGLPVDFSVIDDTLAAQLQLEARKAVVFSALDTPASALGMAFATLGEGESMARFTQIVADALRALATLVHREGALPPPEALAQDYARFFGVPDSETEVKILEDRRAAIHAHAPGTDQLNEIAAFILAQKAPSNTQKELAITLAEIARLRASEDNQHAYQGQLSPLMPPAAQDWTKRYGGLFYTQKGEFLKKSFFVKDVQKAFPELSETETALKEQLAALDARRRAFRAYTRSLAVSVFAQAIHTDYTRRKKLRGAFDFDDLIAKLRLLLADGQVNWVQFKLDAAIDHILVDEAQDTTAQMWDIIRTLSDEFFAGEGRSQRTRTLFVVGDEKQSIYSFQGADPAVFEQTRDYFGAKAPLPNAIAKPVELVSSFRASADVLAFVDKVFATPERREGLGARGAAVHHLAARGNYPGYVEIWDAERPEPASQETESQEPASQEPESQEPESQEPESPEAPRIPRPPIVLADRIADQITGWLKQGERHLESGALVQASDILVLVRKRGAFSRAILRALRHRAVPVSGADRLKLQTEPVIDDLLGLAEAVLCPRDDLALACALKSPLFGLDDPALEALARYREATLWQALAADKQYTAFAHILAQWAQQARSSGPFAFFAQILSAPAPQDATKTARKALLERLGPDAGDPLDAFLLAAQEAEREGVSSLLAFVHQQRAREDEIKRELAEGDTGVRVMTVHGAKGLEAKIVFLVDLAGGNAAETPVMVQREATGVARLLFAGKRADEPPVLARLREENEHKERRENRRLFYVGMTRASDRLYLCGLRGKRTKAEIASGVESMPEDPMRLSWLQMAQVALADHPVETVETRHGLRKLRRLRSALPASEPHRQKSAPTTPAPPLPDWVHTPYIEAKTPYTAPIRASEQALFGHESRRRGRAVHSLYEKLPDAAPHDRMRLGEVMLRTALPDLSQAQRHALVAGVVDTLAKPDLSELFAHGQAEVAIAGLIPQENGGMAYASGRIDRLLVTKERVLAVDFKTMRSAGPMPEAFVQQMRFYTRLLQQLYPNHAIAGAILFTHTGELVEVV